MAFAFEKVKYVNTLMEAYEHICDPVEQVRMTQVIVDAMALRPRLNLEGTYFEDCYKVEIDVVNEKREFIEEILREFRRCELEENENI